MGGLPTPPDTRPDWWLVSAKRQSDEGSVLRFAFRERPPTESWVPGYPPSDAEIERLALYLLEPPPPSRVP